MSPTSNSWYVDYIEFRCVKNCEKGEGQRCGGRAKPWQENTLVATLEQCCKTFLWWESDCAFRGARQLTETLDGDRAEIKLNDVHRAVKDGVRLNKAMGKDLLSVERKLEEIYANDKVMEGRIAAMEGDIKEMEGDIKEMKELLAQLVSKM